jgi:DNA polymerase large subunit
MDYNTLVNKELDKKFDKNIKEILQNPLENIPNIEKAVDISKKYFLPLHPRYIFYWNELSSSELVFFLEFVKDNIILKFESDKLKNISFPQTSYKRNFEVLGVEHKVANKIFKGKKDDEEINLIVLDKINSYSFLYNLGIDVDFIKEENDIEKIQQKLDEIIEYTKNNLTKSSIEIINEFNFLEIRDKGGTYIGARMGRPEKAKMRKKFNEETNSQGLFPVGYQGGRNKNIVEVLNNQGYIEEEFRIYYCDKCKRESIYAICEICQNKTRQLFFERYSGKQITFFDVKKVIVNIKKLVEMTKKKIKYDDDFLEELKEAKNEVDEMNNKDDDKLTINFVEKLRTITTILMQEFNKSEQPQSDEMRKLLFDINKFDTSVYYKKIKLDISTINSELRKIIGVTNNYPKVVKGISSTINKNHTVEHISKAFFRAKNNVYVNKDGTIRYDMIEMGITHFKPKEIGTSIEKLKELGYTRDFQGNKLENQEQTIEIYPQDVILPDCAVSGDELASDYIINTGNYIDDLLENLYGLERFYNFKTKDDTIGHLLIGLAPHTSAGIVGRIIGYSSTQGCFSHPVWHAAQRRNLDGDENGIMLLLDGLINFSRDYLPDRRGSRTMDVSLVLTSHLYLDQIDDEVHGMDIVFYYPIDFYRATKEHKSPKDVKIEKIDEKLDVKELDEKYFGYGFTHDIDNFNNTILCSSYKSLPSMNEKLDAQLDLAKKLRAVDEHKVGTYIIDKHFMKDIKGNLRKFSMQTFRCTNCNTKYRRPPLTGKCIKCGLSTINFTVHEGSIKKYMQPSFKIIKEYDVDPYIVEVIELTDLRIKGVFGEDNNKEKDLKKFK